MVEAMEIQKGFKKTDAGTIPGAWQVPKLIEIADFENGKAHEQFIDDKGEYIVVNSKFISTEGNVRKFSNKNLSPLKKGSIAIVMSDIPNGRALAKCYLVEKDNRYTLNQRIGCIKPNEDIDYRYLFYKLNRNIYFLSFDSGSGQTNLRRNEILDCPVAIPPTKAEQTAIAEALNDADALITELEKLIAKKKAIKQGAMQELLKPKDGWEEKKLGELFDFKQGVQCPVEKQFFTSQHGLKRFIRIIDLTQPEELPRYILDPGSSHHITKDDLFMVRYGTPGLLGYGFEGVIANNLFRLLPKKKICSLFFFYLLQYKNSDILNISSSTTMAALNFTALRELELAYPMVIDTQIQIAQILTDTDAEIEALEKKLDKYKMLKQGMMQNLLTGKIRLI